MKGRLLGDVDEICMLDVQNCKKSSVLLNRLPDSPRPLLVGVTTAKSGDGLVIMGGSAVCFSFGTFWNKGCYTIRAIEGGCDPQNPAGVIGAPVRPWRYMRTLVAGSPVKSYEVSHPISASKQNPASIPRVCLTSAEHFEQLLRASRPVIFEGSNIGTCTSKWTNDYLKEKVGPDRKVCFTPSDGSFSNIMLS